MASVLLDPLPEGEIENRRIFLIEKMEFSSQCVDQLQSTTKTLCAPEKAKKRVDVLLKMGFEKNIIETNPTLLNRSSETLMKRCFLVRTGFVALGATTEEVFNLMKKRPQLWSCGHHKLFLNILVASNFNQRATPQRLCNIITLNIENVLLACIDHISCDYVSLRGFAVEAGRRNFSASLKQRLIVNKGTKLPKEVFDYYKEHFVKK